MPNIRMILLETAMVAGILITGLSASQLAYAAAPSDALPVAADPQADVEIDSSIMVERTAISDTGESVATLHDPATVKIVPGDKLLITNSYHNTGESAVTGFVVNNRLDSAVTLVEVLEDWALVSVDGGQNFGKLTDLSVADGAAKAADVTHIRWVLPSPIEPDASGELRFRGIVK